MKKILILCALLFIALPIGGWLALPHAVNFATASALRSLGFENPILSRPHISLDAVQYTDIALDPDRFSTIKNLQISFQPGLFRLKKSLRISGLNITGNLFEDDFVSIDGWQRPDFNLHHDFETLQIENAALSFLSDIFKGITLNFDFTARKDNGATLFEGRINATQKTLYLSLFANGIMSSANEMLATIELESGKFEGSHFKISRLQGQSDIVKKPNTPAQINGKFAAGSMTLYDLPWHNVQAAMQGTLGEIDIATSGQSLGQDGVDILLVTRTGLNRELTLAGQLKSTDYPTLKKFLQDQDMIVLDKTMVDAIKNDTDITVDFEINP